MEEQEKNIENKIEKDENNINEIINKHLTHFKNEIQELFISNFNKFSETQKSKNTNEIENKIKKEIGDF